MTSLPFLPFGRALPLLLTTARLGRWRVRRATTRTPLRIGGRQRTATTGCAGSTALSAITAAARPLGRRRPVVARRWAVVLSYLFFSVSVGLSGQAHAAGPGPLHPAPTAVARSTDAKPPQQPAAERRRPVPPPAKRRPRPAAAPPTTPATQQSRAADSAAPPASYPDDLDGWTAQAQAVLAADGDLVPSAAAIEARAMTESSGNPLAENHWDANQELYGGTYGLMQLIPPTFQEWCLPGYTDILDPVDSIIAAVRYANNRYGSFEYIAYGTQGY
jgi:soluble lytic murein transglycosylase-like protein